MSLETFECIICCEIRVVAMNSPCQHKFCSHCIFRMLDKTSNEKCPLCRAILPDDFKLYDTEIFPSGLNDLDVSQMEEVFPAVCSTGDVEIASRCIDCGVNVNQQGIFSITALCIASENGHVAMVKYLIENGANVNQVDGQGSTPIGNASDNGDLGIVKVLVENGAEVNQTGSDGTPPLLKSCKRGNLSIVKFLVEKGADLHQADVKNYHYPLYASSQRGHLSIVKFLIKNGVNVHQVN